MSLSAVLNSARSSLAALSEQTRITSENITNVDNPAYSRRQTDVLTGMHGVVRVNVRRVQDREILGQFLSYTSLHSEKKALLDGLERLEGVFGGAEGDGSPAELIARLQGDIQSFAAMPDSEVAARQALASAAALADALNRGSGQIADIRGAADSEIAASVQRVNDLLSRFHAANTAITSGRLSQAELARTEDTRDDILSRLAEELDIRTVTREDGGLAIYTGGGAVLYERRPRAVSFRPTETLAPGAPGNRIFIDGVPVTGDGAVMGLSSGRLKGLVELRDEDALSWQAQLDETARGLIEAFAESDQSGGGAPDAPGLFTWPGAPAIPPAGTHVPGLARAISLNPAADPAAGGDPMLLRDGGMAGAAYVANAAGQAGFTARLLELNDALNAPRAFDPSAGLESSASLGEYAASSISWLEGARSAASQDSEYRSALLSRASDALSRATGVDLDAELAVMMRIERSYQASARLISTVDRMLGALLDSVR